MRGMSDDFDRAVARLNKEMAGDGPIQKHIILLKLTDLLENPPTFAGPIVAPSPQRTWISAVGALLKRLDRIKGLQFDRNINTLRQYQELAIRLIMEQMVDAIEELKLELELDGRGEIGSAYAPGDYYRYFADLKEIISGAQSEIFVVDPYFNGDAFNAYFSDLQADIALQLLGQRYLNSVMPYADNHAKQYGSRIEVRKSKELHDRLIIIDQTDCWITGGSIKQAGDKAGYLIPLAPGIAEAKRDIYSEIWERAAKID